MQIENRFLFRSNASGVAGHIRRPKDKSIPVQAASSVPVIGGVSVSKAGAKKFGKYLSIRSAETQATGDFTDRQKAILKTHGKENESTIPTETTAVSTVREISVLNRVKIRLVRAALTARSPKKGGREHEIVPEGNRLEGVVVDGHRLRAEIDETPFTKCPTMSGLLGNIKESETFFRKHGSQFLAASKTGNEPVRGNGILLCSIVKSLSWEGKPHPEAAIDGWSVAVPGLGRIYFGELLVSEDSRRLTMVRFQLGSPDGGELSAGSVETNGITWPV